MPNGEQEHDSTKSKQTNGLSLVKQDRFPEGVPAVGPRADTKVVGCLRGGKIVTTLEKKKTVWFRFP